LSHYTLILIFLIITSFINKQEKARPKKIFKFLKLMVDPNSLKTIIRLHVIIFKIIRNDILFVRLFSFKFDMYKDKKITMMLHIDKNFVDIPNSKLVIKM